VKSIQRKILIWRAIESAQEMTVREVFESRNDWGCGERTIRRDMESMFDSELLAARVEERTEQMFAVNPEAKKTIENLEQVAQVI
jgi:hypothetical protein